MWYWLIYYMNAMLDTVHYLWYIIYIYNYYILLPCRRRLVGMEQHLLTINSLQVQYKRVARPFALAEKWNSQRRRLLARGWLVPRKNAKVQPVPDSQFIKSTKQVARNGRNHQLKKNAKQLKPSPLFWVSIAINLYIVFFFGSWYSWVSIVTGLPAVCSEVWLMAGTKICLLFKMSWPALGLTQAHLH